jgi:hypothetical protein
MLNDNARPHTAAASQDLNATFGWEQFDHLPYSPESASRDFHVFLHLKTFLGGRRFHDDKVKKPLTRGLHRRRHHSTMQGYKNWCPATISALTMVETMSKSSATFVHQMAI